MPRRKGPPDAMSATYGNKSEHVRIRVTSHEHDLMSRALRHGGYESQSQFIRAAIVMLAEQTLAGPSAVEQQLFAQRTIEQAYTPQPAVVEDELPPPEPGSAFYGVPRGPDAKVVPFDQPTFDQLLRAVPQGVTTPGGPVEAPLDFDEEGWVG